MKTYRKTATVQAKLFQEGDEDGMIHPDGMLGAMEDVRYGITPKLVPYISTLENQYHKGEFGKHYVCTGVKGERWLVDKDIFESTYEEIIPEEIQAAQKFIQQCHSDMGFMGSPEYYEKKKLVEEYFKPS